MKDNVVNRPLKWTFPFLGGAASPENLTEKLDTLYSTTWQLMRAEVVDNVFSATPLWFWLNSRERVRRESGGRWIGIPVMHTKNSTVKSVASGGQIDITNQDPSTTAKYDWKWNAGSVVRLYSEDHQNTGQQSIMSLMQSKLENLKLSLVDILESQAFGDGSGNNGIDILGLKSIVKVDPTTNPSDPPGNVGGIDAATNTYWRNQTRTWSVVGLPTGDSEIAFNMRKVYNASSVGNDHPTLLMTEVSQFELYEANLTNLLRINDREFGDVGFEALRFKGAAITFSPSAPPNQMRFLNERYLEFVIEQSADFDMTPWKAIPDQLDRVAQIVVQGNLVTSNRRMQGVLHTMP